ncbi:hypothetical protein HYQ45_010287 [Verticillium longisporum]|uniref:Uncharacterized protein n=1 Tax=Verticillium longisporum TaxID=100787 RepID=A0A8I3AP07_VERLO|nr:hypothetical protein HYQ45_010287 [Verticillium longisporum]RBQ65738.1 hypothetical protein VDGD_21692 [Verticillium dahliae]
MYMLQHPRQQHSSIPLQDGIHPLPPVAPDLDIHSTNPGSARAAELHVRRRRHHVRARADDENDVDRVQQRVVERLAEPEDARPQQRRAPRTRRERAASSSGGVWPGATAGSAAKASGVARWGGRRRPRGRRRRGRGCAAWGGW